ncbi:MAG TPA: SCO family protein [Usitatibacter sp.]|nr:SCO family protein [Usitatibacter sp.]
MSLLFACLLAGHAFAHGPDISKDVGFEQHPGGQLPMDLPFVDDAGRATPFGEALHAKPTVLVLGYLACRDLCPTTLAGITQTLDRTGLRAGRDYSGLFVSIDPRETAGELGREKSERIAAQARGGWTFLRGDEASVGDLARAVGFRYRYEPEHDAFAHAAGFAVLTPRGGVSRYFLGVRFDPDAVAAALREAARGAVAPPASPLLLLCYHFDPLTGRYTLRILDILRGVIAALLAAIALGAWVAHRRARNRREANP